MRAIVFICAAALAGAACAAAPGEAPPDGAAVPDPQQLQARVAGKSFDWHSAHSKATARVQYNENGYVFINLSTGVNDSGQWTVRGSQLCAQWQKISSGCNEARVAGDTLWLQRTDGTWATMTPR